MKKQKLIIPTIIALGASIAANGAYADTASTDFSITVNPSASLIVSAASVNLQITPNKSGVYDSASLDVTASTNSTAGYTLTMATSNTSLTSSIVNVNTGTNPTIPSIAESQTGISAADFAASTDSNVLNHWGLAIGNSNFNAIKSEQTIKTTDTNITNDTTTLSMASKLDLNTVPGVYSTTLNFQLTANTPVITLEDSYAAYGKTKATIGGNQYYSMQDMTSAICEYTNVIPSQLQVYDNRDNTIYWIAKLADNKCWMTQNLDLNLVHTANDEDALYTHTNTDLGWTNTDLNAKWNPTNSTIQIVNNQADGWTSSNGQYQSADAGNRYVFPSGTTDASTVYDSLSSCVQTEDTTEAECSHYHIGNYYGFRTAIAGSAPVYQQAAADSICPAGWRLPAGAIDNKVQDFAYLFEAYDLATINSYGTDATMNSNTKTQSRQAPIYQTDASEVNSNGDLNTYSLGQRVNYRTSTGNGGDGHIFMNHLDTGMNFGTTTMAAYIGYSIRCVAR